MSATPPRSPYGGDASFGSDNGFIPSGPQGYYDATGIWRSVINNGGQGGGGGVGPTFPSGPAGATGPAGAVGPSTPANIAGTAGVVAGATVPPSIAAATAGTAAAMDPITLGLIGGSILANIYGGQQAAGASREAAQIQGDAAKYVADLQSRSTGEALGLLREQDQRNRDVQAPWVRVGQGAVTKLGFLTGVEPSTYDSRAEAGSGSYPVNNKITGNGDLSEIQLPVRGPGQYPLGGIGGPDGPIRDLPTGGSDRITATGRPQMAERNASTYQTVSMRAPNGQVKAVPIDQVAHYKQLGATLVDEQEVA
jgi:hypothetical protein